MTELIRRNRSRPSARPGPVVDPGRGLHRRLHAAARRDDRERRAPRHPGAVRRVPLGAPVGHRRLRAEPGRAAAHRRLAGRHLRAAQGLRHRYGALHARLAALRTRARASSSSRSPAPAQGIGGAAMFATSLAILGTTYTGKDRGVAFGAFGATTGVAVAIGPVLGGILTSGLSWRWIFFVNLPICLVAMFISLTKVHESKNPHAGRPDWIGFVTFSSALGLLVYGLIEAGSARLGRPGRRDQPGRRRGADGGLRGQPAAPEGPDVRPGAAQEADLHRRPARGVRCLGVDLLAADLHRDLPPERPRLLRGRDRRPAALPLGGHLRRLRRHRPVHGPPAHPLADRPGLPGARRRPAARDRASTPAPAGPT